MPLKPILPGTDRPKAFDEFAVAEQIDWIVQTRREVHGLFGVAAPLGFIDAVALKRCLAMFEALPEAAKADGELVGAVDDLRELLSRVSERPSARARA